MPLYRIRKSHRHATGRTLRREIEFLVPQQASVIYRHVRMKKKTAPLNLHGARGVRENSNLAVAMLFIELFNFIPNAGRYFFGRVVKKKKTNARNAPHESVDSSTIYYELSSKAKGWYLEVTPEKCTLNPRHATASTHVYYLL